MDQKHDRQRRPQNVAIYVMPDFSPFHISVPLMAFGKAMPDSSFYAPFLFSENVGTVVGPDGFCLNVKHNLTSMENVDVIVIPYWPDPDRPISQKLKEYLINAAAKNKTVLSLCLGTYVLAYAGLLNGKRAATHWAFEKHFADKFPNVRVDFNALYVEDGHIITSSGTAARIDCCLYLIRKTYGGAVANYAARMIVTPPHRDGGQAQYLSTPVPKSTADQRINGLLETIRQNLSSSYSLNSMANQVGMSRRNFTQRFYEATGQSPMEWLCYERLHYSQQLLETTTLTIDEIASSAGFLSAEAFRRSFVAHFKITPSKWRQTFCF